MSPGLTVGDVALVLDQRYPADQSDRLRHGEPDAPVQAILLAVGPTPAVIAEATSLGAGLVVTHSPAGPSPHAHPFGPDDPALYIVGASADGDAAQALASFIGLHDIEPLVPDAEPLDTLVTFVPDKAVDQVIDALAEAGAGTLGHYRRCAWTTRGVGTFIPQPAARPAIGSAGFAETVPETRVEMMVPRSLRDQIIAQLTIAHPYEEPAYYLSECVQRPRGLSRRAAIRPWLDVLATYLRASLSSTSAPKIMISEVPG